MNMKENKLGVSRFLAGDVATRTFQARGIVIGVVLPWTSRRYWLRRLRCIGCLSCLKNLGILGGSFHDI